jgi:PAS domain S-box-containing protein
LVGQSIELLLPDGARGRHREARAEYARSGAPRHMAGRHLAGRHRDGRDIPVEVGLNPVTLDGRPYVVASVLDITRRREAERALAERETRLRSLLDNAHVSVSVLTPDGVVLEVNRYMLDLLGVTEDAIVGHHIREFQVPGQEEETVAAYQANVRQGEGRTRDVELRRPDGTTVLMDFSAVRVRYGDDDLVLTIGRDVTAERRMERQLQMAQRMEAVGRLAGGVAHDFNNLLTAIRGYAELLREDLPDAAPGREDVDEILTAAGRATALTRQLLAFSRQQVLRPRIVDLNELATGTEKLLRRLIGEDVQLAVHLAPVPVLVKADPGQIEQVIINLAVNSRDAMPQGGTLAIETSAVDLDESYAAMHLPVVPGPYVMLTVTDTGVGMSKDVQARIFEPFFTTKEAGKGTGLGLATVYGIVKQSDGYIWVYSEPGQGTTFRIYLPRVAGEADAPLAAAPVVATGGSETILLVEDDEPLRRLARQVLERHGYTVLDAADPEQALAVAAHVGVVQLLLTDVVMPGMGGRELAERLLRERPGLKVLYISGYADDAIAHHGMLTPGAELLQKPYGSEMLLRKVRETLDR